MKIFKKLFAILGLTIFVLLNYVNIFASVFNDLDENNPVYPSAIKLYKMGVMLGDLQGNFNPNSSISKFDTMKILYKMLNDDSVDLSKSNYLELVSFYNKKYKRWDSSANDSLIFLLEKQIIKEDELNNFIVIDKNKNEKLRALSKEEISIFLSRLYEDFNQNNNFKYDKPFLDEKDISKNAINSCYYMNSKGIITTIDNKFYPKNAIKRGELALILDKFLVDKNFVIQNDDNTLQPVKLSISNNNLNTQNIPNIQNKLVTIQKVFTEINYIQVKTENETKVYKLAKDVKIYIDKQASKLSLAIENKNANITIKNNEISNIDVKTNLEIDNKKEQGKKIYGVIKNISDDSIALSYKQIDKENQTVKEKIDIIYLPKDFKATQNGLNVNKIKKDSLATVILENNLAKKIILEDKNISFIGTILEKNNNIITIKTTDDKIFELPLIKDAKIIKNKKQSNFQSLKIGDSIVIEVNNSMICNLYAKSDLSEIIGVVQAIRIDKNIASIDVEIENLGVKTFIVDNTTADIYSIKVLDKVLLKVDSLEVYDLNILERLNKNSL